MIPSQRGKKKIGQQSSQIPKIESCQVLVSLPESHDNTKGREKARSSDSFYFQFLVGLLYGT